MRKVLKGGKVVSLPDRNISDEMKEKALKDTQRLEALLELASLDSKLSRDSEDTIETNRLKYTAKQQETLNRKKELREKLASL